MTDVISRHDTRLFDGLSRAPQTNETARASALYPGLLEIARLTGLLLSLHEIGASAGLNLMADRFAHEIRQPRIARRIGCFCAHTSGPISRSGCGGLTPLSPLPGRYASS